MARIARVVVSGFRITSCSAACTGWMFSSPLTTDKNTSACYFSRLRSTRRIFWLGAWMGNHAHFVVVPRQSKSLSATFGEAHRRYTRMVNFREGWRGHLWQERFHSYPMDEHHLLAAVRYVEMNPARTGLVQKPEDWEGKVQTLFFGQRVFSPRDP